METEITKLNNYSYHPTKSTPTPCSTILTFNVRNIHEATSTVLHLATNIVPPPDTRLCSCMMSNLECVIPGETTNQSDSRHQLYDIMYQYPGNKDFVEQSCSQNPSRCFGITINTTSGDYGSFTGCNQTERYSWVLNQLYMGNGTRKEFCQSLNGVVKQKENLNLPQYQCKIALQQAGLEGKGTVSYAGGGNTVPTKRLSAVEKGIIGSIVTLALLVVGILLWFRRSKARKLRKVSPSLQTSNNWEKTELPGNSFPPERYALAEIPGIERIEMASNVRLEADDTGLNELPTIHNDPVELDSNHGILMKDG
jgi:X8 domain